MSPCAAYRQAMGKRDAGSGTPAKTLIPKAAGRTVIYADRCAVSDAELDNMGVTFRKIPRDIARL